MIRFFCDEKINKNELKDCIWKHFVSMVGRAIKSSDNFNDTDYIKYFGKNYKEQFPDEDDLYYAAQNKFVLEHLKYYDNNVEITEYGVLLNDNLWVDGCLCEDNFDFKSMVEEVLEEYPSITVSGYGYMDYHISCDYYVLFTDNKGVIYLSREENKVCEWVCELRDEEDGPEIYEEMEQCIECYHLNNTVEELRSIFNQDSPFRGRNVNSESEKKYKVQETDDTEIIVCDGIECIDDETFSDCKNITRIIIPASITEISDSAFENCECLSRIDVDKGNKNYSSVDGVLFNNDMTMIIRYPVAKPEKKYEIPWGVKIFGSGVFSGCKNLTHIIIPDSVTEIDDWAFDNYSELSRIDVNGNNENYSSEDGILFNKDMTILEQYPVKRESDEYIIPEHVNRVLGWSFCECKNLVRVTIPSGISEIELFTFSGCKNLECINIPDSVTSIEWGAFGGCPKLTIHAPKGSYAIEFAKENKIKYVEE